MDAERYALPTAFVRTCLTSAAALIAATVAVSAQPRDNPGSLFQTAMSFPWEGYGPPHAMTVADVNGDGRPDILAATCNSNVSCDTVAVLLGNGDGTFRGPTTFSSGGNGASAITVADVTRDGRPDLLVANFASDTIGLLPGNGDGTFEPATTQPSVAEGGAAAGPTAVTAADLNRDGVLDIVVANSQSSTENAQAISVLIGNSNGSFRRPIGFASGGISARTVTTADLNGDNALDLVVSNDWASFSKTKHGTIAVLLGDGTGGFAAAVPYNTGGWGAASAAMADVDADGTMDVVVANGEPKSISVLLGKGDGTLAPARTFPTGGIDLNVETRSGAVAIADVDRDGLLDVLAGTCFGEKCAGSIFVLAGKGDGTFAAAVGYDAGGFGAGLVAAADLNDDAAPDAVVATCQDWRCSNGSAAVMLNADAESLEPAGTSSFEAAATSAASTTIEATAQSGQTSALGASAYNLRVISDASPDLTDLNSLIYSTTSLWPSSAEKVWALFYWSHILKRQTSPIVLHGFEVTDPIRNLTDFGFTMCSTISGINQTLYEALGLRHEYWDICNHTVSNVEYDGRFHMVDSSMSNLVTLEDGVTLASVEEAAADSARLVRLYSLYATSPNGFLTGSDTMRTLVDTVSPIDGSILSGFANAFCATGLKKRDYYYNWDAGHRYVLNLRPDETYTRYYRQLGTTADYWIGSEEVANPNPSVTFQNDSSNRFRLHGNGLWTFSPPLTADAYQRALYSSTNIAPAANGGLQPAASGTVAEVIYKVQAADVIASQNIQAQFSRPDRGATASIAISVNHGATWVNVASIGNTVGSAVTVLVNLRAQVNGAYETLIRVQMTTANNQPDGVALTSLKIDTVTHVNAKALPALNVGRNEIYVGAGAQSDTMVLWPDLRGTLWQKDVYSSQNIASQDVSIPRKYTAVVYPSTLNSDAHLIYRFDAPTDVTQVTYGGRLYNYTPGSYIDFLHSFDGGVTWSRSYRLDTVNAPHDVIHYETVVAPPGVRRVLFKYLIHSTSTTVFRASGLYSVRMEVNHQPAGASSSPVDVTWSWKEVQADRTTVTRTHKQRVDTFPFKYIVNVGGSDHPVLESIKVNASAASDSTPFGYSDGINVGGEKFVHRKIRVGTNLAVNKPYTFTPAPTVFQASADATNATILTNGVVGAPQTGSFAYWWGQCWTANQNVSIQIDLGQPQTIAAVRAHLFGYEFWDPLKGEVQDQIEILTSTDGVTFTSQGFVPTSLWKRDIPVNYMLLDEETATGWNFERRLAAPVSTRYVRYRITPKRSYLCISELQVLDRLDYEPFDIRIALPTVGSTANQPPIVSIATPAPGSALTAPAAVSFTANALDGDGTITHVEFLVNGVIVNDDTVAPWGTTWTVSAPGTYTLTARAYDDDGAVGVSSSITITAAGANQAPAVAITSPASGTTFPAGAALSIVANASDADGSVAHVEFLVNGVVISDDTSAPWSASWTASAPATYNLTARAYDNAGAVTTSAPVSIVVQQSTAVPGEDVVLWAAESLAVFGWALTAEAGAAGGARLQTPDLGVAALTTALAAPTQYFDLTFYAIQGRGYRLWIRAKAEANSYFNDSAFVQFDHSLDQNGLVAYRIGTTGAVKYVLEECSGCGVSGWGWSDNGYGTLGPLIYFDSTGPQRIRVQNREDGLGIDQVVLSSRQWLTQSPGAAKNDTTILARTDPQQAPNLPPTVSVTSPAAGAVFATGAAVALTADAADADGSVAHVEFLVNGAVINDDKAAPWAATWNASSAGSYTVTARAYDNVGALTTSAPVTITVNAPANQLPTVSISNPTAGATFVTGATVTIDAVAADADGSVAHVEFLVNGVAISDDASSPWSATWTAATAGTYTLTARAYDNVGAVTTSAPVGITVNPTPNQPPSVSISSPTAGATFVAGTAVTIDANAGDADGTVAHVEFLVNGVVISDDTAAPWSSTWSAATGGTYTLTARAYDNAGGITTSAPVGVTVTSQPTNQPPTVSITSPTSGITVSVPTALTIAADAADPDGTITRVEFLVNGTVVANVTAAPWQTSWTVSSPGSYTLTARAYDNGGAVTTSASVVVRARRNLR